MTGKTISEKILSAKSGTDARAGDVVICKVDYALGTDGSTPMAIDYFNAMGGKKVRDPERIVFALDHYAPAPSRAATQLHQRMREFATIHGIKLWDVGEGIGHQLIIESGRALPGNDDGLSRNHAGASVGRALLGKGRPREFTSSCTHQ